MNKSPLLAFSLFCSWLAGAQSVQTLPRKLPGADKPACSPGAICFAGEVSAGKEFRRTVNAELEFVLEPGWNIAIMPKRPAGDCHEFASVVNAPCRAHRDLYIDMSYGWTAEEEVSLRRANSAS